MKFNKLILNNIGPYKGYNEFSFRSREHKNIILIGGKNGSGKTTFLNSIRLGLFGPLAYGKKTASKEYLNKISSLLNNQGVTNNERFYIQLQLSIEENYKRKKIEILRSWSVNNNSIKETVNVAIDGTFLNEIEKNNFFESLRTTFPPSLIDLCIFDGEEITKLITGDNLSNYLKDLSMILFNLDLFRNLEKDLLDYLSKNTDSKVLKEMENEKESLEMKLREKKRCKKQYDDNIQSLKLELEDTVEKYRMIKREFTIHGGLLYEEREQLRREILNIENNRKQVNEQIKEFIAKYLPFYISYPIFSKLVNQLKDEEDYYLSNAMKEKINNISLQKILHDLGLEVDSTQTLELKNKLIELTSDTKKVELIHHASKTEVHHVINIFNQIKKERLSSFAQQLEKNKSDLEILNSLKQKLKDNETTSDFQDMIISMEQLSTHISNLEMKIENYSNELTVLEKEIEGLENKLGNINEKLYKIFKTNSSFKETEKILKVCRKYQVEQLRKKMKDVEYFSSNIFKDLLRKKMFFNRFKIDPNSFEISLLDDQNNEINKEILSAGEKELMVLSIIWGIYKSSKKKIPFVFDTLLGRLDLEHKKAVLTKLIPQFGEQVIILVTDAEIDKDQYLSIRPHIANEYTLKFDQQDRKTQINHHFFNKVDKVVN